MNEKKVDHTNVFESYIAQDIFVLDVLEKIANDWKRSHLAEDFNRDNFELFVFDELPQWFEMGLNDFLNEEFEE